MQKLLTFFQQKSISVLSIFNDQSFNDTLTNDIVSFEQLGPALFLNQLMACCIQILSHAVSILLNTTQQTSHFILIIFSRVRLKITVDSRYLEFQGTH